MKRYFSLLLALVVMLVFGSAVTSAEAGSYREPRHVSHRHIPGYGALVVRNGVEGDLPHELQVEVTWMNRRGKLHHRPSEKVTVTIAGGGSYRWEKVRRGRLYLVTVTDVPSGQVLLRQPYVVIRGVEMAVLAIPGVPDPRVALIAALNQQVETLTEQATAAGQTNSDLQTQIIALNQQAIAAAATSDNLQAQVGSLIALLAQASQPNADLVAQISALQAELATANSQKTALAAQLAALQAQQATTLQQNVALQAQITTLTQQIAALQAQIAAGQPVSTPIYSLNSAFTQPAYTAGMTNVRIGSFLLVAPAGQNLPISSLFFHLDSHPGLDLQNLKVNFDGVQFGTTLATVTPNLVNVGYSAPTPREISNGGTVVGEVLADVLSSSVPGTYPSVVDLTGWTITGSAASFPATVAGQNVKVVGGPVLTISNWSSYISYIALAGSTGNRVASVRVTADGTDDIGVPGVVWHDNLTGGGTTGLSSFNSFNLYDGQTKVAGPVSMTLSGASVGSVSFSLTGYVVPKNGTRELVIVGDAATFVSGAFVSGSEHTFKIAPVDITAVAMNNTSVPVTVAGEMTQFSPVLATRTNLTIGGGTSGATTSRARISVDQPVFFSFNVDAAGAAQINSVSILMTGTTVPSTGSAPTAKLIGYQTGSAWGSSGTATATWDSTRGGWVATLTPAITLAAGSSGTANWVMLEVNSTGFANNANQGDDFRAQVVDVSWSDGTATLSGWRYQSGTGYVYYE